MTFRHRCSISIYSGYCSAIESMPWSPHEFFKVFLLSSDYWPSVEPTIDRAFINWPIHRWSIDEISAKCRWKVGEVSVSEKLYRPRHTCRPTIVRVSTDYRPLYRPSVDRLSTECRPTIDRLSTAISTYRSVDTTYSKHDPLLLGSD